MEVGCLGTWGLELPTPNPGSKNTPKACPSHNPATSPGGVLKVYMTGGSDVFFWVENLHARYFFGSRDLSRIFLDLKKIRVFFWVLSPRELIFSVFVVCKHGKCGAEGRMKRR